MQNAGIELRPSYSECKTLVRIEPARFRQVMLNLLMNAKDATGAGGQIQIDFASREQWIGIRVSDNGPGIWESDRKKIFDPFFKTKEAGSGLRLAWVKWFVEEANGRIGCASNGSGVTFLVNLPAAGHAN